MKTKPAKAKKMNWMWIFLNWKVVALFKKYLQKELIYKINCKINLQDHCTLLYFSLIFFESWCISDVMILRAFQHGFSSCFVEFYILENNPVLKEVVFKKKNYKTEIKMLHIEDYGKSGKMLL